MANTGAPWNLPYPLATDLVIDGASDIEALADAAADGLTATKDAGNITSGTLNLARAPRGVSPVFTTAGTNTVALVFDAERVITRTATGTVVFTGATYTAGVSVSVRVVAGGASRNLSFPAGWKFVSFKPASIAANKTGVLAVTSFGTSEADCVAAFAVES